MVQTDYSVSSDAAPGSVSKQASTWVGHEGAAAFDLRSDTMTTPTPAMLAAITRATLLDDVMQEDPTTSSLEAHVASLTGKQAGLFVLSGTMGNQIGLRALLTQPPHAVLCDHRSHIYRFEAGGVSSLCGAMIQPVVPRNGLYLTLEDVREHAVVGAAAADCHSCPTRVISLENTLGGVAMPLEEARRISQWVREVGGGGRDVKLHLDGARLWEVAASERFEGDLRDFCELFDTVTMCFSKGLGAPCGSILVGDEDVVSGTGRRIRKAIGGGLRQAGVLTAAARVAVDITFGEGPSGKGGLLRGSHETARRVEALWVERGGKMAMPVETNICWLDLGSMSCGGARLEELGREEGLKLRGNRIITHYQVGEEAIRRLTRVFDKVKEDKEDKEVGGSIGTGKGTGPYA